MKPERWQKFDKLFHAALERAPEERAAFLDDACAGDESLCKQVEALLAAHEEAGSFIESPAMEVEARGVAADQGRAEAGLTTGETVSHYRIISPLGSGGMGEVYLAQDTVLRRQVALKLLPAYFTRDRDRLRRFQQEARAASALNHPNIITIFEIGQVDDRHFMVTEFIDGTTLRQHFFGEGRHTSGKQLRLREVLDIAIQTADALAAAHEAGIVHRDIKPENIMVRRRDSYVKVLDFGLAKLTEGAVDTEAPTRAKVKTSAGVVMGTASYMSPEQARGEEVDARTDLWSLGVVLYELLAGCGPFERSTPSEVIALILEREPPPLARYARDIPERLEEIVAKALTKKREERYQSAKDLLVDLKRLKQRLEVRTEIERSVGPEMGTSTDVATDSRQNTAVTREASTHANKRTSNAQYIVTQIQKHKKGFALIASVVLAAILVVVGFLIYSRQSQPLTEKDTILLADFVNTTGDAVFDGTLRQGLAIQLEQSPFLNIFSDQRVRETLRLMGRSPEERVTKDVAREVCQRQGLKAYLAGSISGLGSHYVITLEAVNAETGDTFARQQVAAESKEQVLSRLGQAATKLREKLGESLASIQKYDAPIEQATTPSLEALKAFQMGWYQTVIGENLEAIPLYKRAIELDPNIALAYDALAHAYNNVGQRLLAREASQKAFELRDRTSEYEKLKIAESYYWIVTGEVEKAIEATELLARTYPRDATAHNNLAAYYNHGAGRYERAIEEARETIRLNPNGAGGYYLLALALGRLNRFDEAKEIEEQALAQKLDAVYIHEDLYEIAFVQGDTVAMQQQLDWARGKPEEYLSPVWQAGPAEFLGQLRRARELSQRGVDAKLSRNLKEAAAEDISWNAARAAVTGNCREALEDAARASALPRTHNSFFGIGVAQGLCGELSRAQSLANEYAKQYPKRTLVNAIWLPAIRAAIEIRSNKPAEAIRFLQSANRYDRVSYWPQYLRGQAYLAQDAGPEAAAEFQKILDRRGLAPTSVLYPLAHLGLGRAYALNGDIEKARKAYDDFFALWKDADLDLPILIDARKEHKKLK